MRKLVYFFAISVAIIACNKDEQVDPVVKTPTNMSELQVSANFNWSASEEGVLYVSMENTSDGNISTEGEILLFVDNEDNVLARSIIKDNKAIFNLKLPEDESKTYYLFYPNSANKQELQQINGQVNMQFAPSNGNRYAANRSSMVYDKNLAFHYFNPNASNRNTHDLGPDLVQNGDFLIDNMQLDSRSWTELREPGLWYYTKSMAIHPSTIDGELLYYNYSTGNEVIEQSFAVLGGAEYEFSMDFGSTTGSSAVILYLDNFNAAGAWIGETHVTISGGHISSSGTILNNAVAFQFYIALNKGGWVVNVHYYSVDVNPDSDGDGVNDVGDDYPNDPTKAYKINYPTTGVQTIAFEDLWPSRGDYDFNDLVVTFSAVYNLNAQGYYVDATYTADIDAAGGSIPLGMGIEILDGNKQQHAVQMIDGVTGPYSSIDPDVKNGIILFNNRHDPMPVTYTNTTEALTQDVVTLTVEVDLNENFQGVTLPNIYAYYTEERGREIHVPGMPATSAANPSIFGTFNDYSGTPYRTEAGLPWAIEVIQSEKDFRHPLEKIEITEAYTTFLGWANSSGANNKTWYTNKVDTKVFNPNN